jgi:hypothetical protein
VLRHGIQHRCRCTAIHRVVYPASGESLILKREPLAVLGFGVLGLGKLKISVNLPSPQRPSPCTERDRWGGEIKKLFRGTEYTNRRRILQKALCFLEVPKQSPNPCGETVI